MTANVSQWLEEFANRLGLAPPTEHEQELVLGLAGIAAHASERSAAPISCWLAGRTSFTLAEVVDIAKKTAEELAPQA
jgi:hypothetical protein